MVAGGWAYCRGAATDPRAWHRAAAVSAGDADPIVVGDEADVRSMASHLLSADRAQPVIGLAPVAAGDGLVLEPAGLRWLVGPGPQIHVIAGRAELLALRELLGGDLGLPVGAARVWWPGLLLRSDPRDHPLVSRIDDEDEPEMLAEFARQFHLSRPVVRQEINLIEDARALLDYELATEKQHTRDLKIQLHNAIARAESAEARITTVTRQLEQLTESADRGQDEG